MLEQEVKLAFSSVEEARAAIARAGGTLVAPRRLQRDQLLDTADDRLNAAGTTLRLRRDGDTAAITFKGPGQPGDVKSREEIETGVASADTCEAILRVLGFRPWCRNEKYREDYALDATHVCLDETPIGVYVEVEGSPEAIAGATTQLGRTRADYILGSYRSLYVAWCRERGVTPRDMTFEMPV